VLPLGSQSTAIYALLVVVALTAVNVSGLRESSRTQNVMSALLVLGMLIVVVAGFSAPTVSALPVSGDTGMPALFGTALLFVLFTYGGWNEAAYISAEVKGGPRVIVKVLVLSLALITVVYVLFVAALLVSLGFEGLQASKQVARRRRAEGFRVAGEKRSAPSSRWQRCIDQ
jgi:amino acid transporter